MDTKIPHATKKRSFVVPTVPFSVPEIKHPESKDSSIHPRSTYKAWKVGMDLSPNSPALACYHPISGTCHLIYFVHKAQQIKFPILDEISYVREPTDISVTPYQNNLHNKYCRIMVDDEDVQRVVLHRLVYPALYINNTDRFVLVAKQLITTMHAITQSPEDTEIWLENYAFRAQQSSLTKICEATGAVKEQLYHRGYHKILLMSNTTAKLWFTGYGNAEKYEMFMALLRRTPWMAHRLMSHFNFSFPCQDSGFYQLSQLPAPPPKKKKQSAVVVLKETTVSLASDETKEDTDELLEDDDDTEEATDRKIPNPIQDMVDAWAICLTGLSIATLK